MDKNSIFGILLIAAILIIWGIVQTPDKQEVARQRRQADSLALVQQKAIAAADSLKATMVTADTLPVVTVNDSANTEQLVNQYG
ncbi:MAG: hypothetical protein JXQ80_02110, partial [Bacteroidales bacterium]|nr:hypothetical protein [Bacteroidales bacterium]